MPTANSVHPSRGVETQRGKSEQPLKGQHDRIGVIGKRDGLSNQVLKDELDAGADSFNRQKRSFPPHRSSRDRSLRCRWLPLKNRQIGSVQAELKGIVHMGWEPIHPFISSSAKKCVGE